jgi:ACR3 family arsenite efflux pump ArsB
MWKILQVLKKRLSLSIAVAMVLGLVVGGFLEVSFLKTLILPLTILMVYPAMVTLNFKSALSSWNGKLHLGGLIINFAVLPLVAFGLGVLFFGNYPYLAFGLLLIGILPTSGMTISWTNFASGNTNGAIKMTIIGLVAGSLLTPVYARVFMGRAIEVDVLATLSRIGLIIFLPMVLGIITRAVLVRARGEERFSKHFKPRFPLIATVAVILMIFAAMALRAKVLLGNPQLFLLMIPPLLLFYLASFSISTATGRFLTYADGVALVYGTSVRNLSVALAIALSAFGEAGMEIALIIAVAYIVQVQAAAGYLKFGTRLLKREPARVPETAQA